MRKALIIVLCLFPAAQGCGDDNEPRYLSPKEIQAVKTKVEHKDAFGGPVSVEKGAKIYSFPPDPYLREEQGVDFPTNAATKISVGVDNIRSCGWPCDSVSDVRLNSGLLNEKLYRFKGRFAEWKFRCNDGRDSYEVKEVTGIVGPLTAAKLLSGPFIVCRDKCRDLSESDLFTQERKNPEREGCFD